MNFAIGQVGMFRESNKIVQHEVIPYLWKIHPGTSFKAQSKAIIIFSARPDQKWTVDDKPIHVGTSRSSMPKVSSDKTRKSIRSRPARMGRVQQNEGVRQDALFQEPLRQRLAMRVVGIFYFG